MISYIDYNSETHSSIFPLKYLSAASIVKHSQNDNVLPPELKEYMNKIKAVLLSPSHISVSVSLSNALYLLTDKLSTLPQHSYDFPLDFDCYADFINSSSGIESQVEVEFTELTVNFASKSNVCLADILHFLSDISGEEIGVADIDISAVSFKTDLPFPFGILSISNDYIGMISNIQHMLQAFKSAPMSCLKHYIENKHEGMLCTVIQLYWLTVNDFCK